MFLLGAVTGTPIGEDGSSVVIPTTVRLSDIISTGVAKPKVPRSAASLTSNGIKEDRDLAVRDHKSTLSRREDDWQIEIFPGGEWACNGASMFITTTYPEFPEGECVNLGAYTDSAYFAYAGPGLCATFYADTSCQLALWQVTNVGQCYGGLPAQAVWIRYDCPPLPTGPKAHREGELVARDVAYADFAPRDAGKPFADHHPLEKPDGDLVVRDEHVGEPNYDLIQGGDSDLLGGGGLDPESDSLSSRDVPTYYLELFNDFDRSANDPGCTTWPLVPEGTQVPENTCLVLADPITSGAFQFSYFAVNRCAMVYRTADCAAVTAVWKVEGDGQCYRGPMGHAFVISPTCDFTAYGGG
ncbi:MAG: hypothetical protein Q9157_001444 [Trypethelium eluteriae]